MDSDQLSFFSIMKRKKSIFVFAFVLSCFVLPPLGVMYYIQETTKPDVVSVTLQICCWFRALYFVFDPSQ